MSTQAPVSIFMLDSIIYVTVCTPKSFGVILPTAALSCQLQPYPPNCSLILPTAALSSPYPANCQPTKCLCMVPASMFMLNSNMFITVIHPTAALSCANCRLILSHLPPYHVPTADSACANCRLSRQLPPYPSKCRPIQPPAALG